MYKPFLSLLLSTVVCCGAWVTTQAQQQQPSPSDTTPITSIDADLANIFNQRQPKKYKVTAIKVTGNNYFDQALQAANKADVVIDQNTKIVQVRYVDDF